jgi:hypothetical protein
VEGGTSTTIVVPPGDSPGGSAVSAISKGVLLSVLELSRYEVYFGETDYLIEQE